MQRKIDAIELGVKQRILNNLSATIYAGDLALCYELVRDLGLGRKRANFILVKATFAAIIGITKNKICRLDAKIQIPNKL